MTSAIGSLIDKLSDANVTYTIKKARMKCIGDGVVYTLTVEIGLVIIIPELSRILNMIRDSGVTGYIVRSRGVNIKMEVWGRD